MARTRFRGDGMRYLLFGAGFGLGLGLWSTLSIFVWERYANRVPPAATKAVAPKPDPVAFSAPPQAKGPPIEPAEVASSATASPGAPSENDPMTGANNPDAAGQIPAVLRNAPQQWISEKVQTGGGPYYAARLSLSPPGIRIEECGSSSATKSCEVRVYGSVIALTADTVTIRGPEGTLALGWKISGEHMSLIVNGRELRFRPGTKEELLKLLASGSHGGR